MKRKDGRYLTPREVRDRCAERGALAFCGGQVVALIAQLQRTGWPVVKLATLSKVSRQLLDAALQLKKFPAVDKWWRVARAFGLKLSEFDALAEQAVAAGMLL